MKKLITMTALAAMVGGCGLTADELADAIARGDAGSVRYVTYDLGLPLDTKWSGEFSSVEQVQNFRLIEGSAAVEQVGAEGDGKSYKQSAEVETYGVRTQHIIGRAKTNTVAGNNDSIIYNTWQYLVEETQSYNEKWNWTEVVGTTTTEGEDLYVGVVNVNQRKIWENNGDIREGNLNAGIGGGTVTGRKNLKTGEFFIAGNNVHRVVGTEDVTLNIGGADKTVKATVVEVRSLQNNAVQDDLIASCFDRYTYKEGTADTDEVWDATCPRAIISGLEYWYRNMLVKAEVTYQTVTAVATNLNAASTDAGYNKADPGYGWELIANCDPGTGTTQSCRFFSTDRSATVNVGADSSPLGAAAKRYFHYELVTATDSWTVTTVEEGVKVGE
jgi:hypothetical protein